MVTTVEAEAELGHEIGACVDDTGQRTYLNNIGTTAWSVSAPGKVTTYYATDEPAVFLPLRLDGGVADVLGPYEGALVGASPSKVAWHIDERWTVVAAQLEALVTRLDPQELTKKALDVAAEAPPKGSAYRLVATCGLAAYSIAKDVSEQDASVTLKTVSTALGDGRDAAGCGQTVAEYDEARIGAGLEARFGRIDPSRFEVTGGLLEEAERSTSLAERGLMVLQHVH
ncbi:hypothetical protein GCM10009814_35490 [Lapillicoccus jejuensis]|uniref:Uncharacterized protein n=1 Tax=Lapillicoccus jejuensis TaxID=402171 RepID=A0A542DVR7_9MICO|nr:hypothetical protein [Lapillicoccus jejuensis]TQJ07199.1 hypothetical protein FB458_0253 [Lapillicoccus jejuensis]